MAKQSRQEELEDYDEYMKKHFASVKNNRKRMSARGRESGERGLEEEGPDVDEQKHENPPSGNGVCVEGESSGNSRQDLQQGSSTNTTAARDLPPIEERTENKRFSY